MIELRFFEVWLDRSGIEWKGVPPVDPTGYEMKASPINIPPVRSDARTLELFQYFGLKLGGSSGEIAESWEIAVSFPYSLPLNEIKRVCSSMQQLVTIGAEAPSSVTSLRVAHSRAKRVRELNPGLTVLDPPARLYLPWLGSGAQQGAARHRMLFSFDDIGGLDGIYRWLDTTKEFGVVIDALVGHWYLPEIYVENRFFSIYTAAESLVRIKAGRQGIGPFKKRLVELADKTDGIFASVVGDVDRWASEVIKTRVNQVVHRGLHEGGAEHRLNLLSETIYILVVINLLIECGFKASDLVYLQERSKLKYLKSEVEKMDWEIPKN